MIQTNPDDYRVEISSGPQPRYPYSGLSLSKYIEIHWAEIELLLTQQRPHKSNQIYNYKPLIARLNQLLPCRDHDKDRRLVYDAVHDAKQRMRQKQAV